MDFLDLVNMKAKIYLRDRKEHRFPDEITGTLTFLPHGLIKVKTEDKHEYIIPRESIILLEPIQIPNIERIA